MGCGGYAHRPGCGMAFGGDLWVPGISWPLFFFDAANTGGK
jgi:hypothetical protein